MRIDYFLKLSRLVKRRPLAKEMCDKQMIVVNGQVAKAGKELRVGDVVAIVSPHRLLKVRVEQLPERAVVKADAATLYAVIEDIQRREENNL